MTNPSRTIMEAKGTTLRSPVAAAVEAIVASSRCRMSVATLAIHAGSMTSLPAMVVALAVVSKDLITTRVLEVEEAINPD